MASPANGERRDSLGVMVFSATFYGVCSASMNFINKFVLNSWSFNQPGVILVVQLLFLTLGLKTLKSLGQINLIPYNIATAKSCALLSFLYSSNTLLALFALSGMNVPMYAAMRRCVPMASILLGLCVFTKRPSLKVVTSVIVITVGAVIAALGDLQFDFHSYVMGCLSAFLMASYLISLQYNGIEKQLSSIDLLYVNSINCMPIIALMSIGSIPDLVKYPHLTNVGFLGSLFFVVLSGCLLNYSMFLCTTVNSALTTTCVGVIKSGFATVLGMYAFGGVTPTPFFMIGLSINFAGGVMFTYAKYQQRKSEKLLSGPPIAKI